MALKKSKAKATTEVVNNLAKGWKKCKMAKSGIAELVDDRILQTCAVIQWQCAKGEDQPYEGMNEIILFRDFVEHALAIPTSDFFSCSFEVLENPTSSFDPPIHSLSFYLDSSV